MSGRLASLAVGAAMTAALVGCGGGSKSVCTNADGVLSNTAFVFVQAPTSGQRVLSGFRVTGCSSTFEGNVIWRLRARDGHELATGFTDGGSLVRDTFQFTVAYTIREPQVGQLEVDEPSVTTEGFSPVKNVVPLVLEP